jgi:hypothetical protein
METDGFVISVALRNLFLELQVALIRLAFLFSLSPLFVFAI